MASVTAISPRCRALLEFLESRQEPAWRFKQVLHGIYRGHAKKWHHVEGLPDGLKMRLKQRFGKYISSFNAGETLEGDQAQKVLLKSHRDGARVEAVGLQFRSHRSLCISSQVGCAFQCAFCATGKVGLKRQLDADEISDQVLHFLQRDQRVQSISMMGMGEPLANPKVFDAIRVLTSPELYGFSARRINVSTVGVIPGILKLSEELPQVNLSFSLHSPFTEERNKLVPLNRMYPMAQVFEALDQRIRKTGRRVWISYLLLRGQNDTPEHAKALVSLLKERPAETRYLYHLNLLPYNVGRAVPQQFSRVEAEGVDSFQKVITESRISTSYRNSFGHSIDAACGQLFAGYGEKGEGSQGPPLLRPTAATLASAQS